MIQKIEKPSIVLPSVSDGSILPGDTGRLLKELDRFEEEVNALTADLERIDSSVMDLRKSFDEVAQGIYNLGSASAGIFGSGSSSKTKGVLGMLSLAIKGAGYATQKYKQNKGREEYAAKRQEILSQKEMVAEEKLPHVWSAYTGYCSIAEKIEAVYMNEVSKTVVIGDTVAEAEIAMMRAVMGMHLKSRYLLEVMKYCIGEMEAWKKGRHSSSETIPTVDRILTWEISQWENTLCSGMPWDLYLFSVMGKSSGQIPLPIALLLSSPSLLRCYVGINIGSVENCPFGLLQMGKQHRCGNVKNPLVLNNPYYRHCVDIVSNKCHPPRKPLLFSLPDLLILLLIPAAFFGLLLLIFRWEQSTGWRIFFMIPALCWAGIAIDYLRNNSFRIMPGYRRMLKYNEAGKAFRREMMKMEDCREFHVFY